MTVGAESVIHTLNGDVFAVDLVGKGLTHVFTWDGERVTVGQVVIEAPVLQVPTNVVLDDETSMFLANTTVLLRDYEVSTLGTLAAGTSLLPIYLKKDGDGYPMYREPGVWNKGAKTTRDSWNWRRINRMVAEWKLGRRCAPGDIVSFIDGDRTRCEPDNLEIDYRKPKVRKQKAKFAEPIFEAERLIKRFNHKVGAICVDISREMFSIKGLKTANLGTGGIFVSVDTQEI